MNSTRKRWAIRGTISALVLIVLACSLPSMAQTQTSEPDQYQRTRWDLAQELSAGRIQALAQTPDGYLWIGTSEGLFRFDGLHFTPFLTEQKEPLRHVLGLAVDRQGSLWVRTADTHVRRVQQGGISAPLAFARVTLGIVAMNAGLTYDLYATDAHKNVIRTDGDRVESFPFHINALLIAVAEASDGRVWLGADRGLFYLDPKSLTLEKTSGADQKINCLLPGKNGHVWLGTDNGLADWDGHQVTALPFPGQDITHLQILTMMQDSDGNLWLGTSRGLLRYSASGALWLSPQTGTANIAVTTVVQDREGDIWYGSGATLERLESTPILPVQLANRATDESFGPVYVDAQNRVWFAKLQGGLFWMQHGVVHAVTNDGLSNDIVYSIDGNGGDIWLGRRTHGLTRLRMQQDGIESRTWTTQDGLAANSIYALRAAPDGTVWAGTLTAGISRFRDGKFTTFNEQDGLPSNAVSSIEIGKKDELWIGTPGGLCKFDGRRCNPVSATGNAEAQEVLSLLADPAGGLWIGTTKGLFIRNERGLRNVSIASGPQPAVRGLGLDGSGRLWIVTDRTVMSAQHNQLLSPGNADMRLYGQEDGLASSEGVRRSRSVVMDTTSHVWIATNGELAMTASGADKLPYVLPHVEEVAADGTPLNLFSPHVPAGAKRVSFIFTGLDLHAPTRVRFRYRLDNFDKSWSEVVFDRQATYTNLAPGKYTFRLIASNQSNSWNSPESTVQIVVAPLLWQRWSVRLVATALLIGLIIAIYRTRTKILISHANAVAEERVRERTRIAREVHDTLLQGFISSLMHLHVVEKQIPGDAQLKSKLSFVLEGMERVIEEARQAVVGLRTPGSANECLESSIREFFIEVSDIGEADLSLQTTGTPRRLSPAAFDDISSIAREAILNAVRHANAKYVRATLSWGRFRLKLQVVDDGSGMDAATLQNGRPQHWGFTSMRERAKHLKAKLQMDSHPGAGTRIGISVPASSAYQRPSKKAGLQGKSGTEQPQ